MIKVYSALLILILVVSPYATNRVLGSETDDTGQLTNSEQLVGRWTLRLFHMEQNISSSPDELVFGCWNMQLTEEEDGSLAGSIEKNGWRLPLTVNIQKDVVSLSAKGAAGVEKWQLECKGDRPTVVDEAEVTEQSLVGTAIFKRQLSSAPNPIACHWIAIKRTKHPTRPIDWKLTNLAGSEFSSRELKGRPTLLVFSQGFSCVHCNEQIANLQERRQAFEDTGATILILVSDTADKLSRALKGTNFPFEFLADPELKVFNAYGLDKKHLTHGATVLDCNGVIQWFSPGIEPEMDMDRLLEEIVRVKSSEIAEIKNSLTSRIQK